MVWIMPDIVLLYLALAFSRFDINLVEDLVSCLPPV